VDPPPPPLPADPEPVDPAALANLLVRWARMQTVTVSPSDAQAIAYLGRRGVPMFQDPRRHVPLHSVSSASRELLMLTMLRECASRLWEEYRSNDLLIYDYYGSDRSARYDPRVRGPNLHSAAGHSAQRNASVTWYNGPSYVAGDRSRTQRVPAPQVYHAAFMCDVYQHANVCLPFGEDQHAVTEADLMPLVDGAMFHVLYIAGRLFEGMAGADTNGCKPGDEMVWHRDATGRIHARSDPYTPEYTPHFAPDWLRLRHSKGLDITPVLSCGPYTLWRLTRGTGPSTGPEPAATGRVLTLPVVLNPHVLPRKIARWMGYSGLRWPYPLSRCLRSMERDCLVHMPTYGKLSPRFTLRVSHGMNWDSCMGEVLSSVAQDDEMRAVFARWPALQDEISMGTALACFYRKRTEYVALAVDARQLHAESERQIRTSLRAQEGEDEEVQIPWFWLLAMLLLTAATLLYGARASPHAACLMHDGVLHWESNCQHLAQAYDDTVSCASAANAPQVEAIYSILAHCEANFRDHGDEPPFHGYFASHQAPELQPAWFMFHHAVVVAPALEEIMKHVFGYLVFPVWVVEAWQGQNVAVLYAHVFYHNLHMRGYGWVAFALHLLNNWMVWEMTWFPLNAIPGTAWPGRLVMLYSPTFFTFMAFSTFVRPQSVPHVSRSGAGLGLVLVAYWTSMGVSWPLVVGGFLAFAVLLFRQEKRAPVPERWLEVLQLRSQNLVPRAESSRVIPLPVGATYPASESWIEPVVASGECVVKYSHMTVAPSLLYEDRNPPEQFGISIGITCQAAMFRPARSPRNMYVAVAARNHKNAFASTEAWGDRWFPPRPELYEEGRRNVNWAHLAYLMTGREGPLGVAEPFLLAGAFRSVTWEEWKRDSDPKKHAKMEAGLAKLMDNPDRFKKDVMLKSDETLPIKEPGGIKPRSIMNLDDRWLAQMAQDAKAYHHFQKACAGWNGTMSEYVEKWHGDGSYPWRQVNICGHLYKVVYASGCTGNALSDIVTDMSGDSDGWIVVAGDDSLFKIPHTATHAVWPTVEGQRFRYIMADLSSFDQSQAGQCFDCFFPLWALHVGIPDWWIATIQRSAKANYKYIKGEWEIWGKTGYQLPTGAMVTTSMSSLHCLAMFFYFASRIGWAGVLHPLARDINGMAAELGFTIKAVGTDRVTELTFCRCIPIPRPIHGFAMLPLPSAVLKMHKMCKEFQQVYPRTSPAVAARLMVYASAQSYQHVPDNYPILGPCIAAGRRLGIAHEPTERELDSVLESRAFKINTTYTPDVAAAERIICQRYGLELADLRRVEGLYRSIRSVPVYVEDVVFDRLLETDYG
jgi:hypothetical protein